MAQFHSIQSRNNDALTVEQLQYKIPALFSEEKREDRSDRYAFVSSKDMMTGLMRAGFQPFAAMQQKTHKIEKRNFSRHMVRFRHPDSAKTSSGLVPEIIFFNSHDGSSNIRLMRGAFRFVCLNGLIKSESIEEDVKISHRSNAVEKVIDAAYAIVSDSINLIEQVDYMQSIQLSPREQQIFANAGGLLRWDVEDMPVLVDQLNQPRRAADVGNNLWLTFNRVQENVLRGGLSGRTKTNRPTHTRDVTGVSENIRLNRSLWQLAEDMARLKVA